MLLRYMQPLARCNPLGQAPGWTAARTARRSFDRRWRRTPTKEVNSLCRSTKVYLPRSKPRTTQVNRGYSVAGRKRDNLHTPSDEERVGDHDECISPLLDHDLEGRL